jgi:hypothetical protein
MFLGNNAALLTLKKAAFYGLDTEPEPEPETEPEAEP